MNKFLVASLLGLFAATAPAQIIGIDDLDPTTGGSNGFPWSVTGGGTSLHVYSANTLRSLGVCAGAWLLDLEVAPSAGTNGTYSAPLAQMQIGHLAVSPPIAGNWGGHLAAPITVHGLASGPYTFPWTFNTYTSLPGFSTAFFIWNGTDDIGIQYTSSNAVTGPFSARRTATQLRHYVPAFNATTQAPTSNGLFALEVRMTWSGPGSCAVKTVYGTGCDTPALTLNSNFPVVGANFTLTTTNVNALSPVGLTFFGDTQIAIDLGFLGAPGCNAYTNANLTSATFPVAAGTGAVTIGIPSAAALLGVTFTSQSAAFTLANPLGLSTSNGLLWTVGN